MEKSIDFARGSVPAPNMSEFKRISGFMNRLVGFSKLDCVFSNGLKFLAVDLKNPVLVEVLNY
jgi:hypothetical protein